MNIAMLGGSFNPPHIGHALVAMQIKELFPVDEIWLMPAYVHPFVKDILPVKHRLAMLRFFENKYTKVSKFEIDKGDVSYTIETLSGLKDKNPEDTFYWISGADQLGEITRWKNWQELITTYNFIIFPRQPILSITRQYIKKVLSIDRVPDNFYIAHDKNLILTNTSSTLIRNRVKSERSITHLVPPGVEEYIRRNKLYR